MLCGLGSVLVVGAMIVSVVILIREQKRLNDKAHYDVSAALNLTQVQNDQETQTVRSPPPMHGSRKGSVNSGKWKIQACDCYGNLPVGLSAIVWIKVWESEADGSLTCVCRASGSRP